VTITHNFTPDLTLYLTSPEGTEIILSLWNGDGNYRNYSNTTFDDASATDIWNGVNPFNGTYAPEQFLANFIGENPNGDWVLNVVDDWEYDTGRIESWGINIQ
jgi:subtilisin-like proprotein convertase family protein